MGIDAWTYSGKCTQKDPINLIFQDCKLSLIIEFLKRASWKKISRLGSNQFIHDLSPDDKRIQSSQLVKGNLLKRNHIRLWNYQDMIIAGVHKDILSMTGHKSADFETAEKLLAEIFRENGDWNVFEDYLDLRNATEGNKRPMNNGKATVINLK